MKLTKICLLFMISSPVKLTWRCKYYVSFEQLAGTGY